MNCTHEWTATATTPAPAYACTQCDATTLGCRDCKQPLDTTLAICDTCLTSAQRLLDDTRDYMQQIPDPHTTTIGLHAIRYDRATTPTPDDARLPHGLDAAYDDTTSGPTGIRTHDGALHILHAWATDWAHLNGTPNDQADTITYLHTHTLWAAQNHPAWHDYLAELHVTRTIVRRLAGLTPQALPVPCVYCGGRIVQEWTMAGLDDTAKCTRCAITWDTKTRLDYTNLIHLRALPDTHPDTLVTPAQARAIYPDLKAGTLRQWLHRQDITPETTTPQGQPLIRLNAISSRVAKRLLPSS